jgi:hypothetical protein
VTTRVSRPTTKLAGPVMIELLKLHRGGVVAQPVGRPGVRPLVHGQRQQERDQDHHPLGEEVRQVQRKTI